MCLLLTSHVAVLHAAAGKGVLQGYSLRSLMAAEQQQPSRKLRATEDEEEAGVPSVAGPLLASGRVGGLVGWPAWLRRAVPVALLVCLLA